MFGYPVTTANGAYTIVPDLPIDDFSRERMNAHVEGTRGRARRRREPARLAPVRARRRAPKRRRKDGTDPMAHQLFDSLQDLLLPSGATGRYYSLPALEAAGVGKVSRLPVSIRIVLESVLRNCDGKKVTEEHVRQLAQLGTERGPRRRDPLRRRPRRAAGLHRRAAARRPRGDAQRRRRGREEPQGDRAAGAGRPRRRPLGDDRPLRHARMRSTST